MEENREGRDSTGPHRFAMEGWISTAPFERLLHMEIVEAAGGKATLTMPFLFDLAQGAGIMHGGALVSLADTAVVMAIKSLLPPKTHFGTISVEAEFLYPVKKGLVTAKAHVLGRQDRTLTGQATVFNEEDRPVLEFRSTFKIARDSNISGITFEGI
jgi:acyl-CoA thioesterase